MKDKLLNWINIFNEVIILFLAACLFMFTDFILDSSYRYDFGWFYLGVIALNSFVNLIVLFYYAITDAIIQFKVFLEKRKMQKIMKQRPPIVHKKKLSKHDKEWLRFTKKFRKQK